MSSHDQSTCKVGHLTGNRHLSSQTLHSHYSCTVGNRVGFSIIAVTPSVINQIEDVSDITGRKHERKHLTEITEPSRSGIDYFLRQRWRRTAFAIEGGYDALRGMVKRQRGF